MNVWTLIEPGNGTAACDAASGVHPVLLSADGPEAVWLGGNPLSPAGLTLPASPQARVVALLTGSIEPGSDDPADVVDAARRTWSGEGRERFDSAWAGLRTQADRLGVALWARPHAGDVMGDVPALRQIAAGKTGIDRILLDPAGLLTPGMLGEAEDHLQRMIEPLEGTARIGATLVTNVEPEIDTGGASLRRVPISAGVLDSAVLLAFAQRAGRAGPVCVLPGDADLLGG